MTPNYLNLIKYLLLLTGKRDLHGSADRTRSVQKRSRVNNIPGRNFRLGAKLKLEVVYYLALGP